MDTEVSSNKNGIWNSLFDAIWLVHYSGYKDRLDSVIGELDRVGITGHSNFNIEYTVRSPFEDELFESLRKSGRNKCVYNSVFNCFMGHYSCIKKSIELGYENILILEDDIRFLKDVGRIYEILSKTPKDYDIVMYDSLCDVMPDKYAECVGNNVNEFFSVNNGLDGASCYSLNRHAMERSVFNFEKCAMPADHYIRVMDDVKVCFATERICIQCEYEKSMTREQHGDNIIHLCYKRSDTDYSKYNIENSYCFGVMISNSKKYRKYDKREEFLERCPIVKDFDETVDMLLDSNRSISRFGDGELFVAFNGMSLPFQSTNENLVYNLRGILKNPTDRCAVALPHPYFYKTDNLRGMCEKYINEFFMKNLKSGNMLDGICYNVDYYDTNFGIFYHHYDLSKDECLRRFDKIKRIFANRKILLVTGDRGIENYNYNIFNDANTEVEVLYTQSKNAFMKYSSVRKEVIEKHDGRLVIAICGPCATVLSYDLSNNYGIRCLDMGHFAKEYNFFMSGNIPYSTPKEATEFYTT